MDKTITPPGPRGQVQCVWDAKATLGEGTCWSQRTQSLWWVDILDKRLHRYRPQTHGSRSGQGDDSAQRDSWQFDEEISAVAERVNGPGLIVTMRRGFALFDPDSEDASPRYLHAPEQEPAGNRFNDGKCDSRGRFWGGTMDFECKERTGAFYRYDAGGSCQRLDLGYAVTNGPTWSLDGRTMFINDTVSGRVQAFDFDPESGTATNRRTWLRFERGDGFPDGMTTDAAGRLWIAHWGGACVSCHDPLTGAELARIALPTSHITNCAFGGAQMRTLFITSARSQLTAEQLQREPLAGALFSVEMSEGGVAASLFAG